MKLRVAVCYLYRRRYPRGGWGSKREPLGPIGVAYRDRCSDFEYTDLGREWDRDKAIECVQVTHTLPDKDAWIENWRDALVVLERVARRPRDLWLYRCQLYQSLQKIIRKLLRSAIHDLKGYFSKDGWYLWKITVSVPFYRYESWEKLNLHVIHK